MKSTIYLLIICSILSCKQETIEFNSHLLSSNNEVLTIEYFGDADFVQFKMFEGLQSILTKQNGNKFVSQINIPKLDSAIFTYDINIYENDGLNEMKQLEYSPQNKDQRHFIWVGKHRNADYEQSAEIESKLVFDTLESEYLSKARELTIYKSRFSNSSAPIIYCTDGSVVESYAPYVDKLIEDRVIKPIDMVGVHSSMGNRYSEYVDNGLEPQIFNSHKKFFFDEVMKYYEKEQTDRQRYLYGFSNGAAFTMYCGINHPEYFEEIIAFSTADYISEFAQPITFKYSEYPEFYMGAGQYEESILGNNLVFVNKMKAEDIEVKFKTFIAGHDYNVWRIEFLEYLKQEFKEN